VLRSCTGVKVLVLDFLSEDQLEVILLLIWLSNTWVIKEDIWRNKRICISTDLKKYAFLALIGLSCFIGLVLTFAPWPCLSKIYALYVYPYEKHLALHLWKQHFGVEDKGCWLGDTFFLWKSAALVILIKRSNNHTGLKIIKRGKWSYIVLVVRTPFISSAV
jgi:hypothetical protein